MTTSPEPLREHGPVGSALHEAVRPARLLLAAKTAAAVAIAWLIAPLMPGVTDEYPYYAPLGALLSMYPTLMGSLRSSLQTLLGLAVGVAIAVAIVLTVGPSVWSIAAAAAVGVLISGTGWFGAGQEYIPVAALFVLIIGGADAEDYSLGYLAQTGVGIAVGLGVNLIVPPAPLTAEASARIDRFQRALSSHLHDIGDAVAASRAADDAGWMRETRGLAETSRALRGALADADESRRGNPRAWLRGVDTSQDHDRLEMLDEVAHQIRDIAGCIGDSIRSRPGALVLDRQLVAPLAEACRAVADALRPQLSSDEAAESRVHATERVERLLAMVRTRSIEAGTVTGPGVLTGMHLQRILLLLEG